MRLKAIITSCTVLSVFACTMFVSCQKNTDLKPVAPPATTERDKEKSMVSLQTLVMTDDAQQDNYAITPSILTDQLNGNPDCSRVITYDNPPGVYPRTVTVDWGNVPCLQQTTGWLRQGKVITTYYGDMADSGNYYIQTYDNYYVNGNHIEGEIKMAHNSRKNGPQNVYRKTQINRKVTSPNGDVTIFNGYRRLVKKDEDGLYPGPIHGGHFKITGKVTGTVTLHDGTNYQWADSIYKNAPLIYRYCEFPIEGKLNIDFTNHASWFVDYGDGTCDDLADITESGVTTTVTVPFMR